MSIPHSKSKRVTGHQLVHVRRLDLGRVPAIRVSAFHMSSTSLKWPIPYSTAAVHITYGMWTPPGPVVLRCQPALAVGVGTRRVIARGLSRYYHSTTTVLPQYYPGFGTRAQQPSIAPRGTTAAAKWMKGARSGAGDLLIDT